MTDAREKALVLKRVPCIQYPVQLKKDAYETQVQALIDSGSRVNAMVPAYVLKLDLKVHLTNVGAQKIDGSTLETFGMVLASPRWKINLEEPGFFKKLSYWSISMRR